MNNKRAQIDAFLDKLEADRQHGINMNEMYENCSRAFNAPIPRKLLWVSKEIREKVAETIVGKP